MPKGDNVARAAKKRGDSKEKISPAFEELVEDAVCVSIEVPSRDDAGAIAALNALTARIEVDFDALVFCNRLVPRFVLDGVVLSDQDFFNRFVECRWTRAEPALRRLLISYLKRFPGGQGQEPWWKNEHALRALVLLDVDAEDVYRRHLRKHDISLYGTPYTTLYREYLKVRGWRHEADLRFSAFLTLRVLLALSAPGSRWFGKSMADLNADIDRRAADAKSRHNPKSKGLLDMELFQLAQEKSAAAREIETAGNLQQLLDELLENAERLVTPSRFVEILIEESKGCKPSYAMAAFAGERAPRSAFHAAVVEDWKSRMNS
jgi:hypothetical protein